MKMLIPVLDGGDWIALSHSVKYLDIYINN